jgi:TPR repeat protein
VAPPLAAQAQTSAPAKPPPAAAAQYNLGVKYIQGDGVAKDIGQAFVWFRKAADQGNVDAEMFLGNAYEFGQGVAKDYEQALAWFRKAARQGNGVAYWSLGLMYRDGSDKIAPDYKQALDAFHKSADLSPSADWSPRFPGDENARTEENKLIQSEAAIRDGISAAKNQDYLVAVRYFEDAQKAEPKSPEIFYNRGLTESKIPGRELSAISFLAAYVAISPHAADVAAVTDLIRDLYVRNEGNISRILVALQDAAKKQTKYLIDSSLVQVAELWAKAGD